jgi:hypothetical protein
VAALFSTCFPIRLQRLGNLYAVEAVPFLRRDSDDGRPFRAFVTSPRSLVSPHRQFGHDVRHASTHLQVLPHLASHSRRSRTRFRLPVDRNSFPSRATTAPS